MEPTIIFPWSAEARPTVHKITHEATPCLQEFPASNPFYDFGSWWFLLVLSPSKDLLVFL